MSFTDRLILWLHIGVAIFTIGPVTAAIMSTPRYIRKRDVVLVGYLHRLTRIYAIASLLVFVFGLVLADLLNEFSKPWASISMTLFVVSIVLLVLIIRDQGAAVAALQREAAASVSAPRSAAAAGGKATAKTTGAGGSGSHDDTIADDAAGKAPGGAGAPAPGVPAASDPDRVAAVERGRIASLGGVTSLIWLVILVLMVWR